MVVLMDEELKEEDTDRAVVAKDEVVDLEDATRALHLDTVPQQLLRVTTLVQQPILLNRKRCS